MFTTPFIPPVLILAFLGGIFNFGWLFSSKQEERAAAEQRQRVEQSRVLRVNAMTRQAAAVKEFERRANAIVTRVYGEEEWRVETATLSLTGWGESAYLSYLFAYGTLAGKPAITSGSSIFRGKGHRMLGCCSSSQDGDSSPRDVVSGGLEVSGRGASLLLEGSA